MPKHSEVIMQVNIIDTYCTSCTKNVIEKNEIISSRSDTVELQNRFYFNVLSQNSDTCTIMIQNGQKVIIRNILYNIETSILIPSCNTHVITVTCNKP